MNVQGGGRAREMMKKATDRLDERARARLCGGGDKGLAAAGYVSSGSEHEADSFCLAGLIHGFLDDENDGEDHKRKDCGEDEEVTSDPDLSDRETAEALEELSRPRDDEDDRVRLAIRGIISEVISRAESCPRSLVRRAVMTRLRESGFNAGICKTKWESSGGLTAGNYEYIDVIASETDRRYVVDLDFAGEFEIARPTVKYASLLAGLPRVLVCRSDHELRRVIRIGANAAKRSMKARGLHLPPWRKNRYMQAKWFGPYRRTTNPVSTSPPKSVSSDPRRPVVGFDARKCLPISAFTPGFSTGVKIAPL